LRFIGKRRDGAAKNLRKKVGPTRSYWLLPFNGRGSVEE
jgi:hypothetical protein